MRTTILIGTALEIGIVLAVSRLTSGAEPWLRAFIALSGLATAAGVLGLNVRHRRQILSGLQERAERLERQREQEVALATITERSRIARELHDGVAHNLSVMLALCDRAAYRIHDAPERVEEALEQASGTGRDVKRWPRCASCSGSFATNRPAVSLRRSRVCRKSMSSSTRCAPPACP